jgi:hypothetical protein
MASQLQPISVSGAGVDLSPRFSANNTVTASPATAAETVVCTIPAITSAVVTGSGVLVFAQIAYTIGTSGASARYRIRQGTTAGSGSVIFDSGVCTAATTAANLVIENVIGFDSAPTLPGQAYSLTLTVGSASATSAVSAASIAALIV